MDNNLKTITPTENGATGIGFTIYSFGGSKIDLSGFNLNWINSCNHMCMNCTWLTTLIFDDNFDTSNIIDMAFMFYGCSFLQTVDLSNFNTLNVTDMSYMFAGCLKLTSEVLNLTSFDTSKVTNMKGMFNYCKVLTSLDLSNFDTSNVTDMSYMFTGCESLTSLDLSSFNFDKVTNFYAMLKTYSNNACTVYVKSETDRDLLYSKANRSPNVTITVKS